ncbi:MAG: D-glycero-beta-D-manno-heptose 1-phosphate adenylyltransferase [Rhizobiaceae bacterium]|nr:D-glycero-beta-D-manno-heptose 1-phosphate adenylyltransferase [Rhizobiaceae bacterium]
MAGLVQSRHPDNNDILEVLDLVRTSLKKRQPRIVVHGDIMLDEYLHGDVERISPEAPIPVLAGKSHIYRPGGAANVAANLASLGAWVDLSGLVGADDAALQLRQILDTSSVNTSNMIAVPERRTTRKLRVVAGTQQIVRIDFEDTGCPDHTIEQQQIETTRRLVAEADVLIISDYDKGACGEGVLSQIIGYARSRGVPVLCDPKGRNYSKYAGASIITPNRKEAIAASDGQLTAPGEQGLAEPQPGEPALAAHGLRRALGLDACLVTLGPDGMFLSETDKDHEIGAFSHDVADVTGAGDCVIAGLGVALACGLPYLSSCIFANAVASISVSKAGSVAVSLDEVIDKYADSERWSASKLVPRDQIETEAGRLKEAGRSIVFTNGCFDILHAGHVQNLKRCAELGSAVIVGLNSDDSVRALKGKGRPINPARDRAAVLLALEAVDAVVIFEEDTPEALISAIRPDILVKGADYHDKDVVGRAFVESYGGRVELVEFQNDISTTAILEKLWEMEK